MDHGKHKRTSMDIMRDMATIRSGKMPTGDKAQPAKKPAEPSDPVEDRRMRMATRRNKGQNKDVNLPNERKY
jgi:hypothetical protein